MNPPPSSPFNAPHTPTFGRIQNVPFIFNTPPPQSPHHPAWVPPHGSSPIKAPRFPEPELRDVDMSEPSPPPLRAAAPVNHTAEEREGEGEVHEEEREERSIAVGALRRVFKSRQKARERSRLVPRGRSRGRVSDDDASEVDEDDDDDAFGPMMHSTSNHYTLNVPAPAPPKSDTPYVLLGCVFLHYFSYYVTRLTLGSSYIQVFFNFSLILVCLYLLVLFILTVQRDVEHRVSEYSMGTPGLPLVCRLKLSEPFPDVVQDIAQCAMHYKANLCETNPIPAMMHQCSAWRTCMDRDPSKIGRAKVVAEMIAEVVNGFVEPISWKTLVRPAKPPVVFPPPSHSFYAVRQFFTLSSLAFLTAFINTLPSFFRPKPAPGSHSHHTPYAIPPALPPPHLLHHAPSVSWKSEVEGTPSRRRKLEGGSSKGVQ